MLIIHGFHVLATACTTSTGAPCGAVQQSGNAALGAAAILIVGLLLFGRGKGRK